MASFVNNTSNKPRGNMMQTSKTRIKEKEESCINNIKLNKGNKREHQQDQGRRGATSTLLRPCPNATYTRRPHHQYSRGSVGNIGEAYVDEQPATGLRRSHSLAIDHHRADEIFTTLHVPSGERRAQLIPRARLIDRNSRYHFGGSCIDNLQSSYCERPLIKRRSSINPELCNNHGRDHIEPVYYSPTTNSDQYNNYHINPPKFIIDPGTDTESSVHNNSYEDVPALSLPNYYPDSSKCDDTGSSSVGSFEKRYFSCDNIPVINEPDSIPYDENIVFTSNRPLYDSTIYAKPKTIRGPTAYANSSYSSNNIEKRINCTTENSVENLLLEEEDALSLDCFETDTNLDEIKLNNDQIAKVIETEEETNVVVVEATRVVEKTNIEVKAPEEANTTYKTIVTVEDNHEEVQEQEENKHSHNYLKEFLESQKGSKKPLQNFILKKFSNLSRRNSKGIASNLIDNQFSSLPDITVTKNLKKCEKIDKKLRKLNKKSGENRFIVNIGKNFDAAAGVPVDFELKIAKVPKKNKTQEQFLQAVKDLKRTLTSSNNKEQKTADMNGQLEECKKEYQEKLDTMRNYWDSMANGTIRTNDKCKIVDEVRKKFEPCEEKLGKVQVTKQLFEKPRTFQLTSYKDHVCTQNDNNENQLESLNPNVVEIISKQHHESLSKSQNVTDPEFDHVRYRVVKSDLFQKKIFANCEKESQFDGLMQYLQDYSFQELLRDNNIVIIEPIRSKIPHETAKCSRIAKNVTPLLHQNRAQQANERGSLRKHFFYHPIRVNKEVNDDELPNPDTVKQVRQFFEGGLKRSQSTQDIEPHSKETNNSILDPDKDRCSASDESASSNPSDFGSQEHLDQQLQSNNAEHCCDEQQYVSEDFLEKVRKCGTTITYYGGRIVKKQCGQPELTSRIMEEIENNNCNCQDYEGVKFRLVKSNSCNSRLELVGTNDLANSKQIYNQNRQRHMLDNVKEVKEYENRENAFNELNNNQPRIIGEERKMTQWADTNNKTTYASINISPVKKINQDYHNYKNVQENSKKKLADMEFEPYEVA